jgi:8-oxo-dGTP diphosphatase
MPALMDPIRIAAAIIDDGAGNMLLVRKRGSEIYIQAGGKIEPGEAPVEALRRELDEEIGLTLDMEPAYLGRFYAIAANEAGRMVEAELFHFTMAHQPRAAAEIAEARWVRLDEVDALDLAPMTRQHVLPIALAL